MIDNIIAVDFDGTLCTNRYPDIGEPIQEVIDKLLEEQKNGAKLILWTCRCDKKLDDAVEWCGRHGIIFDAVNDHLPEMKETFGNNTRKIFAHQYWDDRAVNVLEEFVIVTPKSDKQIKDALEHCRRLGSCKGCPYYAHDANCIGTLHSDAADVINHQKAEIDALVAGQETLQNNLSKAIRAEALKEFAEKLKATYGVPDIILTDVLHLSLSDGQLDNLVKEMESECG